MNIRKPALLKLDDGTTFVGRVYGAAGTTSGPLEIFASATGYQEALTDPNNSGKILVFAFPHIGNVGVNDGDARGSYAVAGAVVREPARLASNYRATGELEPQLIAAGIVGICEIDTRALVRHARGKSLIATITQEA
ncbi:MAG: carbamoyl-phosphate synthase domain-containing protein [Trueperella sp.]|nr:carbamoyl-phosphate synthase domain-containing protein [Trueperella sp.]